jgi:hypothetical protein
MTAAAPNASSIVFSPPSGLAEGAVYPAACSRRPFMTNDGRGKRFMKHITIYKERDAYCSFPHVARLPSGRLAVVFRRAGKFSADAALRGVATHHDPDSSIQIMFSTDGLDWPSSQRRTVFKGRYGVNDPALTVLRDGSLVTRFVALDIKPTGKVVTPPKKIFSHRTEHGLVTTVVGNVVMSSKDSGKTWRRVGLDTVKEIGPACSRDPIVEMADGSWLQPVYTGAPQRADISWVVRSFDRGKHWCEPIRIMSDEAGRFSQLQGLNFNETSLLDLGAGHLLAMVRADGAFHTSGDEFMPVGGVGELHCAESYDSGLSWTAPRRTGMWGQPGSIIKLASGDILCTYGYRRTPFGVRCRVSKDGGKTWNGSDEIILRDDCPTWDCGYAFSIELQPNEIFTVYYMADDSGVRHIAGTHWTL